MMGWVLLGAAGWIAIMLSVLFGMLKISSDCSRAEEERERARRRQSMVK